MPDGVQRELGTITEQIKNLHSLLTNLTTAQNKKLDEIGKKLDYTNGKVRNHDFWIRTVKWGAGIVGTFLVAASPFLMEYLSDRIAEDVQKKVNENMHHIDTTPK